MVSTNLARNTGQRAIEQALALEFELTDLCPNAWQLADSLIGNPRIPTRPWCLLPIEAYAVITLREGLSGEEAGQAAPLLAAFHHWRHTRSVYIFNPDVWTDIFATDRLGPVARIEDFQFPEWPACASHAINSPSYSAPSCDDRPEPVHQRRMRRLPENHPSGVWSVTMTQDYVVVNRHHDRQHPGTSTHWDPVRNVGKAFAGDRGGTL